MHQIVSKEMSSISVHVYNGCNWPTLLSNCQLPQHLQQCMTCNTVMTTSIFSLDETFFIIPTSKLACESITGIDTIVCAFGLIYPHSMQHTSILNLLHDVKQLPVYITGYGKHPHHR